MHITTRIIGANLEVTVAASLRVGSEGLIEPSCQDDAGTPLSMAAADADFAAATAEAENEPSDGNSGSLESNLDENHQQAIEDSLKLYQEAVAQRRKYM